MVLQGQLTKLEPKVYMYEFKETTNLISAFALHQLVQNKQAKVIVLHTSMRDIISGQYSEPAVGYIPGAQHFDFETLVFDPNNPLPHSLPTEQTMSMALQRLGIDPDSQVIVYDDKGLFSAPRVWFMLKLAGLDNVWVLDGGIQAWLSAGYSTSSHLSLATKLGTATAQYQRSKLSNKQQVHNALNDNTYRVIDARSKERFNGEQAEPRAGLRCGHMPGAYNLPFSALLRDGYLLPIEELKKRFSCVDEVEKSQLIFSCGSGVTACVLALAAQQIGYTRWSVYDGSWSEWGACAEMPVATTS